jgi:hypothetical protein
MSHSTLAVLSAPHFPQVLSSAINSFVTRIEAHPLLDSCDFENEHFSCKKPAAVHHLGTDYGYCVEHFQKVVGRG